MSFGTWLRNRVPDPDIREQVSANLIAWGAIAVLIVLSGCGLVEFDRGGNSTSLSREVRLWQKDFNERMESDLRPLVGTGLTPLQLEAKIKELSQKNRDAATEEIAKKAVEASKASVDDAIRDLADGYGAAASRL